MVLTRTLPKISAKLLLKPTLTIARRRYSTPTHNNNHTFSTLDPKNVVNLVEVGPRDGLQNEKGAIIPVNVKVELIHKLARAGHLNVEAGSFVSPKWVPQMAGTSEVLKGIKKQPGVHYAVLVPNQRWLDSLIELLDANPGDPPLTDEVSVFVAATDAFSRANTNCTVAESLERTAIVTRNALDRGLRVRGYVSVVIRCPFSGEVDAKRVREVTKELYDMGCYEVSLGDTVGLGRPHEVAALLEEVKKGVPVQKLAGHFHDTSGTAIANMMTALEHGVRTFDSSVGGLGGCPYSPGATGNVATEDVLYALQGSKYHVAGSVDVPGRAKTVDLEQIVNIGWWISEQLGRENVSRTGRMVKARREREEEERKKHKSKL